MSVVQLDVTAPACVDTDPEVFFPVGRDPSLAEPGKQFCRRCPDVRACLRYALAWNVEGVWGGTSLAERDAIRARHRIAPAPVELELPTDDTASQIDHMNRGGASANEIAELLGVTARTVQRFRAQTRKAAS